MFTGLIEEVGLVAASRSTVSVHASSSRRRLVVGDLPLGASVAVDGVCVTATDVTARTFAVDLMRRRCAAPRSVASPGGSGQPRARDAYR
jgi:riboflavin synthase